MAFNRMIERLDAACRAAAPTLVGVAILGPTQALDPSWFVVQTSWANIRIDGPLTPAQQAAVTTAVNAFPTTPTLAEQFDQFGGRTEAATIVRLSTQWASLTATQQARVQAIIDQTASQIFQSVTP